MNKSAVLRRIVAGVLAYAGLTGHGYAAESMIELATHSGCFICHSMRRDADVPVPLAPAYEDIAARYRNRSDALDYLVDRVRNGTVYKSQNWEGKVNMRFMPPNVNVQYEDAAALVDWILKVGIKQQPDAASVRHEAMLALATYSGCLTCHGVNPNPDHRYVPLAPSFRDVAGRYQGQAGARDQLIESVLLGTLNTPKQWNNVNMRFMPPSVALRRQQAEELVDWILTLR